MIAVLVVDNLKAEDCHKGSAAAKTTVLVAHNCDNMKVRTFHHLRSDMN